MTKKQVLLLAFLVVAMVIAACSLTINVVRDSTDSTIRNDNSVSVSADSTDVKLNVK